MTDLTTTYMGLSLKNPLIASSSPLCEYVDNIREMEDAGIAAVVLHSLFEERISLDSAAGNGLAHLGTGANGKMQSDLPGARDKSLGPAGYLEHIRRVKAAVDIPIIASLNGYSPGGWIRYAVAIEDAGADALELNIYHVPDDPLVSAGEVEMQYLRLVESVSARLHIPVAVKISPYFTALPNISTRLAAAGARGLVLFNRFYQPDLDLENLVVVPNLVLSSQQELLVRLRWVAMLHDLVRADFAVTGGVHTARDILKCVLVGADAAMMTSALLKFGIGHALSVIKDLADRMDSLGFDSIGQIKGKMSRKNVADPEAFERANYMKVLRSSAADYL
jgi:dihydroorotate dehydrogenase (fumarate)